MTDDSQHFDLERAIAVLRHRWWTVAFLTLLCAGASFAFSAQQQKKYTATALIVFQDPQLKQQVSGLQVLPTSPASDPRIMATNLQLLSGLEGVARETAKAVGRGLTASDVREAIEISAEGQTDVANVAATSPSPELAAAIANTYVQVFIEKQRGDQEQSVARALELVESQLASLSQQQRAGQNGQALIDRAESLRILAKLQDGGAQLLNAADPPTSTSSPKTFRNTVLGLFFGLLLGLGAAILLARLDRRMRNVSDLEETYQLPLLAVVPRSRAYTLTPESRGRVHGADMEVFRLLRAYLRYFSVDREVKTLLVASAAPGDGKSTIARNLAEAGQETGTKTLLVEADLRRPGIARHYELTDADGLSEILIGGIAAADAIHAIPVGTDDALDVIVAGRTPPNPTELLESDAMSDFLAWAAERYELVIIDTPPLSVVSDALPLLQKVDGVVVVSTLGKNTRDAAEFLRNRLVDMNAPLLGVVANGVNVKGEAGYGYGYGYGYGESGYHDVPRGSRDSDPTEGKREPSVH